MEIQNAIKHLRWSVLRKWLTAKYYQSASSNMFDRVLNTPLIWFLYDRQLLVNLRAQFDTRKHRTEKTASRDTLMQWAVKLRLGSKSTNFKSKSTGWFLNDRQTLSKFPETFQILGELTEKALYSETIYAETRNWSTKNLDI